MFGYQHITSTIFGADVIHRAGLFIKIVLAGAFHLNDKIIALVTALQRCTEITLHGFDSDIIHIFYTGRHNTGHNQLVNCADGVLRRFKNCQQIHAVLRQRQQLHSNLRDDTQGTLAANNQLLQAIACSLLLQARSQLHNLAGRINHLHSIYLMTRSAVFNRTVTAGVCCHVAADKAGITAAGVTCIKSTLGRSSLQVGCTHPRLYNRVHSVSINLNNLIHLFERKHYTAINRHCTAGKTCACAAGHNREVIFIRQLHHSCYLLRIFRKNNSLRHMMISRVSYFIMGIYFHLPCIRHYILHANQSLQLGNYFIRQLVILHNSVLLICNNKIVHNSMLILSQTVIFIAANLFSVPTTYKKVLPIPPAQYLPQSA